MIALYVRCQTKDYVLDIVAARAGMRISKVNSVIPFMNEKTAPSENHFPWFREKNIKMILVKQVLEPYSSFFPAVFGKTKSR